MGFERRLFNPLRLPDETERSFCYGLLNKQQVERLRSDFGIYLPLDGRINVAGLNPRNLPYVVDGAVCR